MTVIRNTNVISVSLPPKVFKKVEEARRQKGFVTILAVLAIVVIGVLGIGAFLFLNKQEVMQSQEVVGEDDTVKQAAIDGGYVKLKVYFAEHSEYPRSLDKIEDIPDQYKKSPFIYKSDGQTFEYYVKLSNGKIYKGDLERINWLLDMSVKNDVANIAASLNYHYQDKGICPGSLNELTMGSDPYIREIRNNPVTGKPYTYITTAQGCMIKDILPDGSEFVREIPLKE